MNSLTDLKDIVKQDVKKRIGNVSEISEGSILLTDLLDRKFRAFIPNEISVVLGDSVIVIGDCIVGKTEKLKEPKIYNV